MRFFRSFMILIISVALATLFFCIPSLIIIIRYGVNPTSLMENALWYKEMSVNNLETLFIINCVLFSINFIFLVLDCNLVYYHIWLMRNKLTTYEHIKMQRQKDLDRLEATVKEFFLLCHAQFFSAASEGSTKARQK